MNFFDALILGIVEGLTEFLPVSSTGHLILTAHLLKLEETDFLKAFEIVIQSGAMLAVVGEYRDFFASRAAGFFKPSGVEARRDVFSLIVAFMPAVVVGLVFGKFIKFYLFGPFPVVLALGLGGIGMIVVERFLNKKKSDALNFQMPTPKQALGIGLFQCLAFWPGMSRAMTTLLGARFVGLNTLSAARFSFLLAVPTLFAATVYDLLKVKDSLSRDQIGMLAFGMAASMIVAWFVIRKFLKFLQKHSLEIFGWYRIALALVYALFFL